MSRYDDFKRLLRQRRFREAAALAEQQALGGKEDDDVFWLNQQSIALLKWGRLNEAIEVAERALLRNSSAFYSMLIRAEALLKKGDAAGALDGFREASRYPEAHKKASLGIGECLVALGRFQEALDAVGVLPADLNDVAPLKIKALEGLGRIEEALDVCQKWLRQSPDSREALWLLCDLEVRRDGLEATLAKYEKLAKIPSLPPIYGELCAMLYRKAGRLDRAIGQYERLSERTADPAILRRKAFALAKSGREKEALPLLEELLRGRPEDLYVHSAYIAAAKRAGYLEEAWKFYHELHSRFPEEKTLLGRIRKIGRELENSSTHNAINKADIQ